MTDAWARVSMPPSHAVSIELEVPLYDVDSLSIVWHGNYFKYLDKARSALFKSRNLDIDDLVELGQRLLIVDASCRYVFPLRYGERFRVNAWVSDVRNRIRISYSIWNLTQDRRAAKAHTVLVTTNGDGKLVWPTPPAIRKRLVPPL